MTIFSNMKGETICILFQRKATVQFKCSAAFNQVMFYNISLLLLFFISASHNSVETRTTGFLLHNKLVLLFNNIYGFNMVQKND